MKRIVLSLALLTICRGAEAQDLDFDKKWHNHDVFDVSDSSEANFSYTYDYYNKWKTKLSGQYFDLEPAPVIRGLLEGVTAPVLDGPLNSSDYEDQAGEFADYVNLRLEGGRPSFQLGERDVLEVLEASYSSTHVVETVLSTVIDKSIDQINIDEVFANELVENIDYDHYHFRVPGTFVSKALEESHSARKTLDENKEYLLSVFDLREYGCDLMKTTVRDYFSGRPKKDQLANESIYLLSDIKFNNEKDLEGAEQFFGKKPDALISQEAMYADHLIRASKMYFAFYEEGEKTRVVFLSNLAMGSQFFTGAKGAIARQMLLDGVGTAGKVVDAVDGLKDLFADAQEDINRKNACDSGLALGLIKYSQSIFNELAYVVGDN